jgi:hypothetical protein
LCDCVFASSDSVAATDAAGINRRWYNESRAGLCSPFFNFHFDGAETNSNVDRDWFAECPFGYRCYNESRILRSCWAHEYGRALARPVTVRSAVPSTIPAMKRDDRRSQQTDVPFVLGPTLGDLGDGANRPSLSSSIYPRALAIAVSRASRHSGLIAGFAQGACTMPFTAAKLGAVLDRTRRRAGQAGDDDHLRQSYKRADTAAHCARSVSARSSGRRPSDPKAYDPVLICGRVPPEASHVCAVPVYCE